MRRLPADRLQTAEKPTLIGTGPRVPADAGVAAPDAEEAARARQKLAYDTARQQGHAEGLREAESEIKREVEKIERRLREEHAAEVQRLQSEQERVRTLVASLQAALSANADEAQLLAVEVAFAAVTRLLGEKSADRSLMAELCQRVVHEFGHPPATLRVSEADKKLLETVEMGIPVEVDRRLAPGQCVIDAARGQFECGLDVRLEALRTALLTTIAGHRGKA